MKIPINEENLKRLSNDYLKTLFHLSRATLEGCPPQLYIQILMRLSNLKEIAREIEEILERKS